MNKTYSNKALPAGTVLREWRLEEVLGVGGFGIVYKGRGIYFDELVAIKEYFPSAISERNEGDTVVPIDSQAEEVHALGLKKFVEEAKLLWNLSTPTRHPNIVSVRSLFEIHGTAYMVMDFEDGLSLSKLLREGKRFNEASLLALIQPIAEGLERAHRVGVLHRDIKPPNILVTADSRPVLIDFGSARFESGDATSTKVTFHTPPYAAIEQYVKTYVQGPWTDIYALGVVLYECVTGEKPPEVLERMHGGLGQPLADGEWPGYSQTFLRAVDAAMTIRPAERPQTISDWLALFSNPDALPAKSTGAEDFDEPTRFVAFQDLPEKIVPVAPPPPDFEGPVEIDTPVPESLSDVQFKRAGQETNASKTRATEAQFLEEAAAPEQTENVQPDEKSVAASAAPTKPGPAKGKSNSTVLIVGAAVVAVAGIAAGGWYFRDSIQARLLGGKTAPSTVLPGVASAPSDFAAPVPVVTGDFAQAVLSLAGDARRLGAPSAALAQIDGAAGQLAKLQGDFPSLAGPAAEARKHEIAALAKSASAAFASALSRDAEARMQRLARDLPWADPRRAGAARSEPAIRQRIAQDLQQARRVLQSAVASANGAGEPGQAIASARQALQASHGFASLSAAAYASKAAAPTGQASAVASEAAPSPTPTMIPAEKPVVEMAGVSPGKLQKFNSTVSASREIADTVIRMGRGGRPGSGASDEEKERYRVLQQGKTAAQGYLSYLTNLTNSMRGAKNDREAELFISQAEQTKRYLGVMLSRSSAASQ